MNQAFGYALGICALSMVLEGVSAGRGFKQRFADLGAPRHSPPIWRWFIVGAFYYAVCFALLYMLVGASLAARGSG